MRLDSSAILDGVVNAVGKIGNEPIATGIYNNFCLKLGHDSREVDVNNLPFLKANMTILTRWIAVASIGICLVTSGVSKRLKVVSTWPGCPPPVCDQKVCADCVDGPT